MSVLIMAVILILIVVATVITKKAPFNFVLMIVPIVCALLLDTVSRRQAPLWWDSFLP